MAFEVVDTLHNEMDDGWNNSNDEDELVATNGQALGDGRNVDDGSNNAFDPTILEDVVAELYKGSKSSKLAITILLMNLCTIHGMNKRFADELLTFLHWHLLPINNCLLVNYHVAKSLRRKLGLDYQNIHACLVGCLLFTKDLADELQCFDCGSVRYKDEENKTSLVKVLRHFQSSKNFNGRIKHLVFQN